MPLPYNGHIAKTNPPPGPHPGPAAAQLLPELDGLRAVAAYGILATHVAFQTGTESALLERFDYFVAVFFALSAFLLARGEEGAVLRPGYYSRRFARLAPAYLVCAAVVLLGLPPLSTVTPAQVAANLLLVQLYVPDGLIEGLTQMWSLCVEVAFYLVLPAYLRLGPRGRGLTLALAVPAGLAWPHLVDAAGLADAPVNLQIWPPSYTPWFAVGLLCAELERLGVRYRGPRWPIATAALPVAYAAGVIGPPGLTHPTAWQFNTRVILGAVFAALVVAPFALGPRHSGTVLSSAPARTLGRWSYSLFLWHVAALYFAFPILGRSLFDAPFLPIFLTTAALGTVAAYVSYELVEVPGARLVRRLTAGWGAGAEAGAGSGAGSGHARHATAKHPVTARNTEPPA